MQTRKRKCHTLCRQLRFKDRFRIDLTNCLYYSKLSKLHYLFCTFSVNFPISLFALPLVQCDKTVILDQLNKSEGWALNSRFLCYLAGRYVRILFRLSRYSQVLQFYSCCFARKLHFDNLPYSKKKKENRGAFLCIGINIHRNSIFCYTSLRSS